MKTFRLHLITLFFFLCATKLYSQCCAGGSGSPIAGGVSQGVLQERQIEVNSNIQYINTNNFYTENKRDTNFFDNYSSNYSYTRVAYGVTKDFTMSVETGYVINRKQIGLYKSDTIVSKGIADIVLFPRYDIINRTDENHRTELTVGLGYKIPLGKYNDSIGVLEPFSQQIYYQQKPMAVQPTSGAQDFIFYCFALRSYPAKNIRFFTNALYIKKGWNPIGEKLGDLATISLFVSKTFFQKLGVTIQARGEWIDNMKINNTILQYAYPNYDPAATGSKKIFIAPQLSYNIRPNLSLYFVSEIPIYQYVTKTQVGSKYQFTAGLSYRFFAHKSFLDKD